MQSSASCQMATACREAPCTAANKIPEDKTGAHHDVPGRLARLHGELIAHDGFGEIRVEIRILRKDQKEVTYIAASNIALSSTTVTVNLCGMLWCAMMGERIRPKRPATGFRRHLLFLLQCTSPIKTNLLMAIASRAVLPKCGENAFYTSPVSHHMYSKI